jgi:hypothetical protein
MCTAGYYWSILAPDCFFTTSDTHCSNTELLLAANPQLKLVEPIYRLHHLWPFLGFSFNLSEVLPTHPSLLGSGEVCKWVRQASVGGLQLGVAQCLSNEYQR